MRSKHISDYGLYWFHANSLEKVRLSLQSPRRCIVRNEALGLQLPLADRPSDEAKTSWPGLSIDSQPPPKKNQEMRA